MKLSFRLHTNKVTHVFGMEIDGVLNPDCQNFELLIGGFNPRNVLERWQATLDVVSCFEHSRSRHIAKGRYVGYLHKLKSIIAMRVPKSFSYFCSTISKLKTHNARVKNLLSCNSRNRVLSSDKTIVIQDA